MQIECKCCTEYPELMERMEDAGAGEFTKASDDTLKSRQIIKAKSRTAADPVVSHDIMAGVPPEDWRTTVVRCNKYLLDNQLHCDVTFRVGRKRTLVKAHRYILMWWSCVFFDMLTMELAEEHREIEIPDVEPPVFTQLLEYLYTGQLQTDGISVKNLLKLAEKYCLHECVKLLLTKQIETMDPETFCQFVQRNEHHMTELMRFTCFEYVFSHPFQVFKSASFPNLPYSFLKEVLGHEYLIIDEDVLCTAVLLWASQKCRSQKMEENGKNQRLVLQDALYLIRFPLLSQDYFTANISESQLLSDKEELQLFRYFIYKIRSDEVPFNINKRKAAITPFQFIVEEANPRPSSGLHVSKSRPILMTQSSHESVHEGSVLRFKERGSAWRYRLDGKDAVAFEVDKDIVLTDVYIYGNCKENGKMEVSVSLVRDNHQSEPLSISIVQLQCELSHATGRYKVGIENDVGSYGIKITAGVIYHVVLEIKGTNSYYGKSGKKEVISDGITFSFKNSYLSTNNTNVDRGQIVGFKYRMLHRICLCRKAAITPFQFIVEEAKSVHEGSVLRFKERGSGWGYRLDRKDAVAFEVDKDIVLTDIYIFGNCNENGKMEVSVSLVTDNHQSEPLSVSIVQLQCELSHATGRYEVGIENDFGSYGIKITAGVVYHVVLEINGTNSYYGKHGKKEVISDGITFSFKNSYLSTNNTNVDMGQIAGLKYRMLPKD